MPDSHNPNVDPIYKEIQTQVKKGLFHDALQLAQNHWSNDEHRHKLEHSQLLVKIYDGLGKDRSATAIRLLNFRRHPNNCDCAITMAYYHLNHKGPLLTWSFIEKHSALASNDKEQAQWLCLRMFVAMAFRDFESAQSYYQHARELDSQDFWFERAYGYLLSDKEQFEQAFEHLQQCYQRKPSAQLAGQLYAAIAGFKGNRQAMAFLQSEVEHFQSVSLWLILASDYCDFAHVDKAKQAMEKAQFYYLGGDKSTDQQFASLKGNINIIEKDFVSAAEHFAQCKDYYSKTLSENLKKFDGKAQTVELKVPQLLQKHMTCAPTTMAAIAQYLGQDVSDDQIAEVICYGGTYSKDENAWLEQNGYAFVEFDLNWEIAKALIDADLPFAMTSANANSNHLQAVVGYDLACGLLHLMDPSSTSIVKMLAKEAVDCYAHVGPRCFVFVPGSQAMRLSGFDFPQTDNYRRYNQLQKQLDNFDYVGAEQTLVQMQSLSPEHWLTLNGQRSLALASEDERKILSANEQLIERFPNQSFYHGSRFFSMQALGKRNQALAELSQKVDSRLDAELIALEFNQLHDSRAHDDRLKILSRLLKKYCWRNSEAVLALANYLWDRREFKLAFEHYRWAVCLSDTNERYIHSYFYAARHLGLQAQTLAWLQQRFEQFGHKSAGPACSLYKALQFMDKGHEGLQVLEKAMALRPKDAELLEFYLDKLLYFGRHEAFEAQLAEHKALLSPNARLQLLATQAQLQGQTEQAINWFDKLQLAKPLDLAALDNLFEQYQLVEDSDSISKRLQWLEQEFGQCRTVLWGYARWHHDESVQLQNWQKLSQVCPDDFAARRNLIAALVKFHKLDEADLQAHALIKDAPDNCRNHTALATVQLAQMKLSDAKQSAQKALSFDVDDDEAFYYLLEANTDPKGKRAAFDYLQEQLLRQQSHGDGIWHYWIYACDWLDQDTVFNFVQTIKEKYAEIWSFPVVTALNRKARGDVKGAIEVLKTACENAPLLPRLHYELAQLYYIEQDLVGAIDSLIQTIELAPTWAEPAKRLSSIYEAQGQFDKAEKVLDKASRMIGDDGYLLGMLADLQYKRKAYQAALDNLALAVRKTPGYQWGWEMLAEWGKAQNKGDLALSLAQDLCDEMPHLPVFWINLARQTEDFEHSVGCLRKAIALSPRNLQSHVELIRCYSRYGEFDQAHCQAEDEIWQGEQPDAIRYEKARVYGAQKRFGDGCETLRDLLQHNPGYDLAWRQLAAWQLELGQNEQAIESIEKLVALKPHSSNDLCFAAENIVTATEDEQYKSKAQAWLKQAFWLTPTDEYIGLTWFDWLFQSDQLTQLEAVVEQMDRHHHSGFYLVRKIQYDCKVGQGKQSLDWFEQMLLEGGSHNLYFSAIEALSSAGKREQLFEIFDDYIKADKTSDGAALAWAQCKIVDNKVDEVISLLDSVEDHSQWTLICDGILRQFAHDEKMPPKAFIDKHLGRIQSDHELFKDYIRLLFANELDSPALTLLQQAQPDSNWEARLLYQYFWGLQDAGAYSKSKEILNFAAKAHPDDYYENITLLMANEKFVNTGEVTESDLININFNGLNSIEQYLYVLLQVILHVKERSFRECLIDIKPILRHAQQLNQAVYNVDLAVNTRRYVKEFLAQRIESTGFFDKLRQKFVLSNFF